MMMDAFLSHLFREHECYPTSVVDDNARIPSASTISRRTFTQNRNHDPLAIERLRVRQGSEESGVENWHLSLRWSDSSSLNNVDLEPVLPSRCSDRSLPSTVGKGLKRQDESVVDHYLSRETIVPSGRQPDTQRSKGSKVYHVMASYGSPKIRKTRTIPIQQSRVLSTTRISRLW